MPRSDSIVVVMGIIASSVYLDTYGSIYFWLYSFVKAEIKRITTLYNEKKDYLAFKCEI